MNNSRPNKWAARTVEHTVFLALLWAFLALVGRSRGGNPYAERNALVTILLRCCLLGGVGLMVTVPITGAVSIARDPVAGKLASIAAIFVEVITVVLSIWYIFPNGLGK
jgi:hypothetical protein